MANANTNTRKKFVTLFIFLFLRILINFFQSQFYNIYMQNSRYQKAEKFYEVPVFIAVVLLIPVIIIEYRSSELKEFANYLNWGIWIVFLLEYVHLLILSENRKTMFSPINWNFLCNRLNTICPSRIRIVQISSFCEITKTPQSIPVIQTCSCCSKIWF